MDAPAVAVSADGKTISVGWMDQRRGRTERDVWWRTVKRGRPGRELPLADDQGGTQGHVALLVDRKGVTHGVWSSDGKILYRTSKDAKSRVISSEREATQPCLATDGKSIFVAYEARKGGEVRSFLRKLK